MEIINHEWILEMEKNVIGHKLIGLWEGSDWRNTLLEAISLTERWVWMVSSWSKHQSSSSRVSTASFWYDSSRKTNP